MKKLAFLATASLLIACNASKKKVSSSETTSTTSASVTNSNSEQIEKISEDINVTVPYNGSEMMLGIANRAGFERAPFNSWFDKNFDTYTVDQATVEKFNPFLKDVKIKTFMGTWCGDSKRETPHFYKVLDAAGFNYDNLTLITVSRQKDTPQGFEKDLNILRVPTIIFYREGKEIGRYVEYARESLEKDMYAILNGADYKHSYDN